VAPFLFSCVFSKYNYIDASSKTSVVFDFAISVNSFLKVYRGDKDLCFLAFSGGKLVKFVKMVTSALSEPLMGEDDTLRRLLFRLRS